MSETVSWDEAVSNLNFVKIETDVEKRLVITNWRNEKNEKFGEVVIEFIAEVLEEDGVKVTDKKFTTVSKRLKAKLRPILEKKQPTEKVKISILRVGEQFGTQYSVKELKE